MPSINHTANYNNVTLLTAAVSLILPLEVKHCSSASHSCILEGKRLQYRSRMITSHTLLPPSQTAKCSISHPLQISDRLQRCVPQRLLCHTGCSNPSLQGHCLYESTATEVGASYKDCKPTAMSPYTGTILQLYQAGSSIQIYQAR